MFTAYSTKRQGVKKFIVQLTGTYNEQYRRPYQSHLDGETQNSLIESIERNKTISAITIAGTSNNFLRPSATPESEISISNGWGTQRVRFYLEIETEDQIGNIVTESVVGYSDHPGISNFGSIDPQMLFFINAVNTTRTVKVTTAMGNQVHHSLIDSSHILANTNYQGLFGSSNNNVYSMRPEDIYSSMESNEFKQFANEDTVIIDARGILTSNAIKSKRSNNIVPTYTAALLDSFLQARREDGIQDMNTIRETAKTVVSSSPVSRDPFLSFLRSRTNMNTSIHFTYADLCAYDSNVPNVTVVAPIVASSHYKGQTMGWGGSDYTTLFATMLVHSIPSYMLQAGISKIDLSVTNRTHNGELEKSVAHYQSFNTGIDISGPMQVFLFKVENELLKGLSYNNTVGYTVRVACDLLGETWISISLNNDPVTDYVSPSFADGLFAPIVTQNENNVSSLASDFESIMTAIGDCSISYGNLGTTIQNSPMIQTGYI